LIVSISDWHSASVSPPAISSSSSSLGWVAMARAISEPLAFSSDSPPAGVLAFEISSVRSRMIAHV
jgi:hypothetical protein